MALSQRIPSFEELYHAIEALPEGVTGEVLEAGVIRTTGRPGGPHRFSQDEIRRALGDEDARDGDGTWWFEREAEVRFSMGRMAVPDLSGWRLGNDETVPPELVYDNPISRRPDWCCEVLSKSTEKVDRELKLPLYAKDGVPFIWLVDPVAFRIEIYRAIDGESELIDTVEGEAERAIPPFESMMRAGRFWLRPR
jgi:Uma2 family endonuclease